MDNAIVSEYARLLEKKARLQKGLSVLPQGYISKKNITATPTTICKTESQGK